MKVKEKHYFSIWEKPDAIGVIQIIDQRYLPFQFIIEDIDTCAKASTAISQMHIRGAPLIGIMAAYGLYLATLHIADDKNFELELEKATSLIRQSRPTAINLEAALQRSLNSISEFKNKNDKINIALSVARQMVVEDLSNNKKIGEFGLEIIKAIAAKKQNERVNILTHCNAGWLATVDYGTATAPIYLAHQNRIKLHIWVDETRPRNQGAKLTAWELQNEGIPHTIISDNAGGYIMQKGLVDLVLVGTDRTLLTGDVVNKTGTYLKALSAIDNNIPFYVAVPSSSIDWTEHTDIQQIPIEERSEDEIKFIDGFYDKRIINVMITNQESPASNFAFDITPAKYITGLITERGICKPDTNSIYDLFPERK